MKTRIAVLCLAVLLTACAAPREPDTPWAGCMAPALPSDASGAKAAAAAVPAPLRARVWLCSDQRTVTLYPKDGGAQMLDRGCQMPLMQVPSASGARYENPAVVFHDKGAEALLQRKPGPLHTCREIALLSQIEDARIRGVTWRGHGIQGDWHLDVGPGPGLTLVRQGTPPLVFARPTSVTDPNTRTTVYSARQGTSSVTVKVTDLMCRDKAGNTLPGSADIVLDGVALEGCGVPLSR